MTAVMRYVIGLLLVSSAAWARAEVIDTLYQESIAVADQSQTALSRAARQGLERVLVRVSGDRQAGTDEGVRGALAQADRLLDAYYYERNPAQGENSDAPPWVVRLSFNDNSVHRLLREASLPIWPANRPVVLTWLVLDEEGERQLINDAVPEWLEGWRLAAEQRGLILRWPLLDLVDRAALSPDAAWQLRTDRAWQAADRYRADAVLLCRAAALSGERWLGSCRFSFEGDQRSIDISAATPVEYATEVVDRLADRLAAQYAIAPLSDQAGILLLQLSGVERFDQYAQLLNILSGLAAVDEVALVSAEADRLVFALTLGVGVERLQSALGLEHQLQAEGQARISYRGQVAGGLHYRWLDTEP